jgi:hypothetical protein
LVIFAQQAKRRSAAAMELFFKSLDQYRSSLYETARGLLRSRNNQAKRAEEQAQQMREFKLRSEQLTEELQGVKRQLGQTQQLLHRHQQENEELRQQPIKLPSDLPLPHHSYGPKMISLCLNLCKQIGFRRAATALKIVFEWLGIDAKIPSWDSMRSWSCRVGIAHLQMPVEEADDWLWMADHSNQIGTEKVLQILGIRASQLPQPGQTLRLQDMRVLAVVPGTNWKREDVRREYDKLAKRIGSPRYLLTDGAVELRESADVLEKPNKKLALLRDMKHYAANTFEKLIGKSDRFGQYLSQLGRTRSAIQQTELSHFTPPPQKPKARFMNLGPTLRWGQMISHHLSDCHSQSRRGVTAQRMNDKLGWMRGFRDDLDCWNRCQEVVQASLSFINQQGVYRGAAKNLKQVLDSLARENGPHCELSATMVSKVLEFVKESEAELGDGERAWLSTENIESSFGLFKRLEGQHSKGGFTSLVAVMPMLLTDWTAELVRKSLPAVSVKQMRQWVHEELGTTLTARRVTAYREFASASTG